MEKSSFKFKLLRHLMGGIHKTFSTSTARPAPKLISGFFFFREENLTLKLSKEKRGEENNLIKVV